MASKTAVVDEQTNGCKGWTSLCLASSPEREVRCWAVLHEDELTFYQAGNLRKPWEKFCVSYVKTIEPENVTPSEEKIAPASFNVRLLSDRFMRVTVISKAVRDRWVSKIKEARKAAGGMKITGRLREAEGKTRINRILSETSEDVRWAKTELTFVEISLVGKIFMALDKKKTGEVALKDVNGFSWDFLFELERLDPDRTGSFGQKALLLAVAQVANLLKVAKGAREELKPLLLLMLRQVRGSLSQQELLARLDELENSDDSDGALQTSANQSIRKAYARSPSLEADMLRTISKKMSYSGSLNGLKSEMKQNVKFDQKPTPTPSKKLNARERKIPKQARFSPSSDMRPWGISNKNLNGFSINEDSMSAPRKILEFNDDDAPTRRMLKLQRSNSESDTLDTSNDDLIIGTPPNDISFLGSDVKSLSQKRKSGSVMTMQTDQADLLSVSQRSRGKSLESVTVPPTPGSPDPDEKANLLKSSERVYQPPPPPEPPANWVGVRRKSGGTRERMMELRVNTTPTTITSSVSKTTPGPKNPPNSPNSQLTGDRGPQSPTSRRFRVRSPGSQGGEVIGYSPMGSPRTKQQIGASLPSIPVYPLRRPFRPKLKPPSPKPTSVAVRNALDHNSSIKTNKPSLDLKKRVRKLKIALIGDTSAKKEKLLIAMTSSHDEVLQESQISSKDIKENGSKIDGRKSKKNLDDYKKVQQDKLHPSRIRDARSPSRGGRLISSILVDFNNNAKKVFSISFKPILKYRV